MIQHIYLYSADDNFSGSVEIDTLDYPLSKFEWPPTLDGASQGKQQAPGTHSWRKDIRNLPIDFEGEILGDTTSDYWTLRKALLGKLIPAYDNTEYDPIKITVQLDGDSEVYYAFCVLDSLQAPLDVADGSPTVSKFMVNLDCRFGYWRKSSDNTAARI